MRPRHRALRASLSVCGGLQVPALPLLMSSALTGSAEGRLVALATLTSLAHSKRLSDAMMRTDAP